MKLVVLGPDINESEIDFTVNDQGHIRFGLSALKGIGEGPVEEIFRERKDNGPFLNFADLIKRLNSKVFNKKVIESCVYGGAFDCFKDMHRAQYFSPYDKYPSFLEYMIRWGSMYQASQENLQASLFGDSLQNEITIPKPPECAPWSTLEKLKFEIEIAGIYLSAHPLDDYRHEISFSSTITIDQLEQFKETNRDGYRHRLAGIITDVQHRTTQRGDGYGIFKLQDYYGSIELKLFKEKYLQFKPLLNDGQTVMVDGTFGKPRFKNDKSEDWEFSVLNMVMLSESLDLLFKKSIQLFISIETIEERLGESLDQLLKSHKGKIPVHLQLLDPVDKIQLSLVSSKKIAITGELLEKLDQLGLGYKLN